MVSVKSHFIFRDRHVKHPVNVFERLVVVVVVVTGCDCGCVGGGAISVVEDLSSIFLDSIDGDDMFEFK